MKNRNHPMSWSLIKDIFDRRPARQDKDWGAFVELMSIHNRVSKDRGRIEELNVDFIRFLEQQKKALKDELSVKENDEISQQLDAVQKARTHIKNGPAFLPCTFIKGNRKSEDVDKVYMIVFDSDSGMQYEEILQGIEQWEHVAATSFSDLPEHRKWRVVLPLEKPVSMEKAAELFNKFNLAFEGKLDGVGDKTLQLYFLPSCAYDAEPEFVHHEGDLLKEDDLDFIELPKVEEPKPRLMNKLAAIDDSELVNALFAIPNNGDVDYHLWLEIGMAIHSEMPDSEGLMLWTEWSNGDKACKGKWSSFSGSNISVGTLFHHAKQNGWKKAHVKREISTEKLEKFVNSNEFNKWKTKNEDSFTKAFQKAQQQLKGEQK